MREKLHTFASDIFINFIFNLTQLLFEKKRIFSFFLLFMAVMSSAVLVSCGDDDNKDDETSVAGIYTGTDNLSFKFGEQPFSIDAKDARCAITENKDGSVNIVFPEEVYDFSNDPIAGKMVGKITQGSYEVKNIPFDKTKNVYYIDYAKTKASAHVTMTGMKMNQGYGITKGSITISFSGNKVKVLNERTFGHQPFPLLGTFEGTK